MSGAVRDLGPVEGHEIPGTAAPAPPVASPPPPPPPGPHVPPGSGATLPPYHPPVGTTPPPAGPVPVVRPGLDPAKVLTSARDETAQALRDIREAHRRGPKPNSRPLPSWVRRLAWVLDDAVAVPGTGGRRIGVDGIIAFVPGIGDAAGLVLSMIVVLSGVGAGVSFPTVLRMLVNVGAEAVAGLIPFGGPVIDMAFKANQRNVRLIEADLADRRSTRRSSIAVIALTLFTLAAGAVMVVAVTLAGLALFAWSIAWLIGRL